MLQYILKPIQCQLFQYSEHRLFDLKNNHLEYFPIVNQRVFPLGTQSSAAANSNEHGSLKDILNVQFKQTYSRFLHQAIHQDLSPGGSLNLIAKQKLQLAYYLQLQDRVDEAITVFKSIDIQAI